MKKDSDYQHWIKSKFGGASAKESIDLIVDSLLIEAKQYVLPIKLSSVAKIIGIDPKPLYFDQPYDGSLITTDDKIRIALSLNFRENNRYSQRLRFTYAHELIHCLAYDFSCLPNKRIAPLPDRQEEEHLCNYGAAKLMLPKRVLSGYFENGQNTLSDFSYIEKIKIISSEGDCSITTVVLELIASGLLKNKPNTLYILSLATSGYHNKGKLKPRCLVGVHFDKLGIKKNFLAPNKGLEHIESLESAVMPWSLLKFHNQLGSDYLETQGEVLINKINDARFIINGIHVRLNDKGYIWSELSYKDI